MFMLGLIRERESIRSYIKHPVSVGDHIVPIIEQAVSESIIPMLRISMESP